MSRFHGGATLAIRSTRCVLTGHRALQHVLSVCEAEQEKPGQLCEEDADHLDARLGTPQRVDARTIDPSASVSLISGHSQPPEGLNESRWAISGPRGSPRARRLPTRSR
jgi:hypothetical protein